jgi:hypothetical protein
MGWYRSCMKAWKPIRLIGIAIFLGCSGGEPPTLSEDARTNGGCVRPFLGDPSAEPDIELVALRPGGMLEPIVEGGSVSLLLPPAAGFVIFAGALVRNMNPCAARIAGELRDPVSEKVRIDKRIIHLEPTNDGWGGSVPTDISTLSNIAVCPNQWSMQDLFDKEYELTMTVTDRDGREVSKSMRVVPTCNEPGKAGLCLCTCKQGYKLGEQCF